MYKIIETRRGCTEIIDTTDSLQEAKRLVAEYRMAHKNNQINYIKNILWK